MRQARMTFPGAFHHIFNRGHNKTAIFLTDSQKNIFLEILRDGATTTKIRILAYCLMTNHFHLILQNTTNRLPEFMQRVTTRYAMYYRKTAGGHGSVFQDRYKSTLIQNESYLLTALVYILQNPVRKKIAAHAIKYQWSSANVYFNKNVPDNKKFIDYDFVEELIGSEVEYKTSLAQSTKLNSTIQPPIGQFFGSKTYLEEMTNRHTHPEETSRRQVKHMETLTFLPVSQVIQEFEKKIDKSINNIESHTWEGKRQRSELLIMLKDNAGLSFRDIYEFTLFADLSRDTLRQIYARRKKMKTRDNVTKSHSVPNSEHENNR